MAAAVYASGGAELRSVKINLKDIGALQRGAKYYVNYCMGCHSLKFMSYSSLARGLRLDEDQVLRHLFVSWTGKKKIGNYMTVSMTKEQGMALFGKLPPDLSTIARSRGTDWLYTYLHSFYEDPKGRFGVNNTLLPGVSMPHVLAHLQGMQVAKFEQVETQVGNSKVSKSVFKKFEPKEKGILSAAEYDSLVKDLVTFLAYVGEPAKLERQALGVWVILFMLVFTGLAYLLKKEYWRDIH